MPHNFGHVENPLGLGINALGQGPPPAPTPIQGPLAGLTPEQIQALLAALPAVDASAVQQAPLQGPLIGQSPEQIQAALNSADIPLTNEELLSQSSGGRGTLFNAFLNQQSPGLNPTFSNALTNKFFNPLSSSFILDNVLRNFAAGGDLSGNTPPAAPGNFSNFLGSSGLNAPAFGGQLNQLSGAFYAGALTPDQQTALNFLGPVADGPNAGTQGLAESLIQNIIGSQLSPAFRGGLGNVLDPIFSAFQTQNPGQGIFQAFLNGTLGTNFGGFGG